MRFPSFPNRKYPKNLKSKLPVSSNKTSQLTSIYLPILLQQSSNKKIQVKMGQSLDSKSSCTLPVTYQLESTNAALKVPHPRPTRPTQDAASDAVTCTSVRVCIFFFSRIHADSAQFVPNRLRFTSNRVDLAKIEPYRPAETCQKRPKSALNMAGKVETCLLLSFFCESRHSNVFFKIF